MPMYEEECNDGCGNCGTEAPTAKDTNKKTDDPALLSKRHDERVALKRHFVDYPRSGPMFPCFLWERGNVSYYRVNFWNAEVDAIETSFFITIEKASADEWIIQDRTND